MATGIPSIPRYNKVCHQCQVGKQVRKAFPQASATRALGPLELLHLDLCGPFPMLSLGSSQYFLIIVDDYSCYIWVHFLKKKSEAFENFKQFKTMIKLQMKSRIQTIRSDRGGEFLSTEFNKLYKDAGI